jgi:hypothetical protein
LIVESISVELPSDVTTDVPQIVLAVDIAKNLGLEKP